MLGWVVLLAISAAVYLPGLFTLPPVDRDESRFAQASRQMFESGDWAVPRVQDRPRLNKPPLIYWLQCASVAAFGDDRENAGIWVYRIPSALCATGAVLLTWRLGRRMMDPRAAFLGAVLLAVCPMVVWDAHQARADQLLLFTVCLTQLCLWQVWKRSRHATARPTIAWALAFWVAIGAGVMAKGPITPMIAALTAVMLCVVERRWRWLLRLQPALGLIVVAAIVGPWLNRVIAQVGWENNRAIIFNETVGRSAEAKEGHWGPPGYHLVLLAALFWPGSLFTAAAVVRAWSVAGCGSVLTPVMRRVRRSQPASLFLLAWLLPSWIVFEAVGTKLPHYTMPLYPALALLSARMVLRLAALGVRHAHDLGVKLGTAIWMVIGLVLAGLAPSAIYAALAHPLVMPRPNWIIVPASFAAVIAFQSIVRAVKYFAAKQPFRVQLIGIGLAMMTPLVLIELTLANLPELALSRRLLGAVRRIDPALTRPIASVAYHEDSLVFLTRGAIHKLDADVLVKFVDANPGAIIIVPKGTQLPPGFAGSEELTGFNYSVGRWTTLVVAQRVGVPATPTGAAEPGGVR